MKNIKPNYILATILITSFFMPLSSYHTSTQQGETYTYVNGLLFNFMTPSGWIIGISAITLLFYERLGLYKYINLKYFLVISGSLTIILFFIQWPFVRYLLDFYLDIKGIRAIYYDFEGQYLITNVSLYAGILSIILAFFMKEKQI